MIPFVDLDAQFATIESEVRRAIDEVLKSKAFIQGPFAAEFAKNFLRLHGEGSELYGVGCANGTSAITVALRALGIGPGDEVLVPNNTFFGTIEPVIEVGARPVMVDILPDSYTMNLSEAAAKITERTRAILPVHLYGHSENMTGVMELAHRHKLKVIEDCAQAHLARWQGQPVGSFGQIATFSFYPGKNLGAYGDAGFILSREAGLIEIVRKLVDHGRTDKYLHEISAGNFRIDGMQAAILNAKLPHLREWTQQRREIAKVYDDRLRVAGFKVVKPLTHSEGVYHLYVIEVTNRDEVLRSLAKAEIHASIHYPVTMSQQPALRAYVSASERFPVSEKAATRIMSLPLYPELTAAQIECILAEFLKVARP